MEKLEKLPENSTNIRFGSISKRFSPRPKYVENMCLSDLCAGYDMEIESKNENKRKIQK